MRDSQAGVRRAEFKNSAFPLQVEGGLGLLSGGDLQDGAVDVLAALLKNRGSVAEKRRRHRRQKTIVCATTFGASIAGISPAGPFFMPFRERTNAGM